MVGDDIHLVMWESVGDVLIAGIGRGGSVVMRTVLPLSSLASHGYVPLLGKGMYPAPVAGCSLQHP
jgi:hypothetical protein